MISVAAEAVERRLRVAKMLMDRDDPENLINWCRDEKNPGLVHLIACRHVDSHKNFLQRLEKLSMEDPLTELANRRSFEDHARAQLAAGGVVSLALIDVYGRVARLLLDMAHNVDGKWVVEHAPPKQEIARMIGASREMVSRVVKDLQRKGLIRAEKRKIFVLDKQSMQRRASTRHHSPREPQT